MEVELLMASGVLHFCHFDVMILMKNCSTNITKTLVKSDVGSPQVILSLFSLPLHFYLDPQAKAMGEMNWIQRKIFLYNVTFGLYMLDWWERCTFNILLIVLMWFVIRYITEFFRRYVFKQYM
ncbi:hypothetical protein HN51_038331 [Arachis hypogaea]